jgi:hypothetical protein
MKTRCRFDIGRSSLEANAIHSRNAIPIRKTSAVKGRPLSSQIMILHRWKLVNRNNSKLWEEGIMRILLRASVSIADLWS